VPTFVLPLVRTLTLLSAFWPPAVSFVMALSVAIEAGNILVLLGGVA